MTKLEAILVGDGRSFEDIASARATEIEEPKARRGKPTDDQSPRDSAAHDPSETVSGAAEEAQTNQLQQGDRP